ncbi:hypothetical protein Csa_006401 [Cucumis sativus]|uniref:Retrotransposon gag domain-containing protein n=1 Tax=Cucumis sativus TaxID=3659 RepID=A0A0A0LHG4_CUCSA|nr:hypothetical protein Csa_006401 [Cucumis sativus]
MSNKNKVLLNNVAPGQEIFALIVHDLNRPIKIQNTGQFDGYPGKDPTSTSKASTLYVINFTYQANRKNNFTLFPLTMRDEAKIWANSLETREVRTWEQLIEKFMKKFFQLHENSRRMRDIMNFQ